MRAITRMRTLAALCALLMLLGSVPVSAWVDKPIDHPEGPPTIRPTEVGEPDTGSGLPALMRASFFAFLTTHPDLRGVATVILRFSYATRNPTPRRR